MKEQIKQLIAAHDTRMLMRDADFAALRGDVPPGSEEKAERESMLSILHALRMLVRDDDLRIERPVTPDPDNPHENVFERHTPDWHEWSVGEGKEASKGTCRPMRLFVRAEPGHLVELTLTPVTSYEPGARELEGVSKESIPLTSGDVRWLIEVLPRALAVKDSGNTP